MRLKRFLSILDARNKEFLRDYSALAWSLVFPFLIVLGFAFSFGRGDQNLYKVGVYPPEVLLPGDQPAKPEFFKTHYVEFVPVSDLSEATRKVTHHQLDLLVSLKDGARQYWVNSSSPKGYVLEKLLSGSSATAAEEPFSRQTVEGAEIRYVDWLIAGILSMNMMFSALFGVGYVIVRYRKSGVLRRLKATPLAAFEFLSAQVLSRLILIVVTTVMVFAGTYWLVQFQMLGSFLDLFIVMLLGAICLISLGLLTAARTASEEFAGGLLNLTSWPMMFFSGVWFSLEGAHPWVQNAAKIFPLTHVIDAARGIMTEGATLTQVSGQLAAVIAMTLVFAVLGALLFRWE